MTAEEKEQSLKQFTEMMCEASLRFFNMMGLETHIETMVINDSNGEQFVLSFKKVIEGKIFDNSKNSFLYTKDAVIEQIKKDRAKQLLFRETADIQGFGFVDFVTTEKINSLPITLH